MRTGISEGSLREADAVTALTRAEETEVRGEADIDHSSKPVEWRS